MVSVYDGAEPIRLFYVRAGGHSFGGLDVIVKFGDLFKVPEKYLAVGVAESKDGVLIGNEVQFEAHEKLRATSRSSKLYEASVRRRTFSRDAWIKGRAREVARIDGGRSHGLRRSWVL